MPQRREISSSGFCIFPASFPRRTPPSSAAAQRRVGLAFDDPAGYTTGSGGNTVSMSTDDHLLGAADPTDVMGLPTGNPRRDVTEDGREGVTSTGN